MKILVEIREDDLVDRCWILDSGGISSELFKLILFLSPSSSEGVLWTNTFFVTLNCELLTPNF